MIVAWLAILTWPFLAIVFFVTMSLPAALVATIVGGYVILPEQVNLDLPGLPSLDKHTIPAMVAFLCAAMVAGKSSTPVLKGYIPRHPIVLGLLIVLFLGVTGTVLTNGDALLFKDQYLPGLRLWDLLSAQLTALMALLPFILGRKYLASYEAQITALKTFVVIAVFYSVFALIEIRLSPQMNVWVYGFFPHSFLQHIRGGGYRPLVFLNHGIWLAIFFTTAILAAAGLARSAKTKDQQVIFLMAALWLLAVLTLSRSLGALLIALLFLGLLIMPKGLIRIGLVVVIGTVILYPLLRSVGAIPMDALISLAEKVNADRAASLQFRAINETLILAHGLERPIFGWGGWDRNLAVAMENGRQVVPDGRWTLSFGQGGYVRFISEFGLLCIGIWGVIKQRVSSFVPFTLALLLGANLIDLLPNATLTVVTWLWAGALAGSLELGAQETSAKESLPEKRTDPAPGGLQRPAYARSLGTNTPYSRNLRK